MRTLAAGINLAPTLATACAALPPEGARFALGRPSGKTPPTLHRCAGRCPTTEGVATLRGLISLGAARREIDAPTQAKGVRGFTLLELMVVVAIMGLATAGVAMAMRDGAATTLEREAQRLGALLESGRAQSRMSASTVRWRTTETGFLFDGPAAAALPTNWLSPDVRAEAATIVLGPEPIIGAQKIRLFSVSSPQQSLTLATDGIRPFAVRVDPPDSDSHP